MKIKICGLKRKEDIAYVNEARPDFAGFILSKGYKRSVSSLLNLEEMINELDKEIVPVGVFVDEDIEKIVSIVAKGYIKMIQLHGKENIKYVNTLTAKLEAIDLKNEKAPIIKVFTKEVYDSNFPSDYHMIDSQKGEGKELEIDKDIINKATKPLFIAGGINISNIDKFLKINPYCIDVSSGVESDGKKDKNKIVKFVERIRNYE